MNEQTWHNLAVSNIFDIFKTSKKGLQQGQVVRRLDKYGRNELPQKKSMPRLTIFLNQITSPLVYVLIFAVIISVFLKHYTDAGVIFFVVVTNTFFGYWQENKANDAIKKLKAIVKQNAKVLRDGKVSRLDAGQLVPGDIVMLRSGDIVPADCRVFESEDLQTIEAPLTGESAPVKKISGKIMAGISLAERNNMIYMGTMISRGNGKAIVCCTGANTEIGKITSLIDEAKEDKTPLQYNLARFSKSLTIIILVISLLIFIQGYFAQQNLVDMFLIVVALAVAAIPEGLLVAVTIILTIGMHHILKKKALVRKLVATETLGCTSIICTDKTGTLTEGKMTVSQIVTADNQYFPQQNNELTEIEKNQHLISKVSVLCSSAEIEGNESELKKINIIGDPTESALLLSAIQSGYEVEELRKEYKKIKELPFDSDRKYMAVLCSHTKDKHDHLFVKGAPERIFPFCEQVMINGEKKKITKKLNDDLNRKYQQLTAKGLRVIGVAYKTGNFSKIKKELNELVWLGFVAIKDPLRQEAKEAIKLCREAGIRPIIITGDHKLTAKAIFEELGIKVDGNMVEGKDLDKWSDKELQRKVPKIDIYARVEPRHKLRVIAAWQARGEVVAMTGDGINDAPAIKAADIGIALGSGSDVTKETADIVLLDNNFSVIVEAVKQGRIIFENIRKVIVYLLTDSFSEMVLIAGALLFGWPLPIIAVQILWINLISDGLPNIAMTLEPGEQGVMKEKPRKRSEHILNREMKIVIFAVGLGTDLVLLGLFYILLANFSNIDYIRSIIFTTLGVSSLFYAFSIRSLRYSIFSKNPFSNKYLLGAVLISLLSLIGILYLPILQKIFHTVSIGLWEWSLIASLAIFKVVLIEIVKRWFIIKK